MASLPSRARVVVIGGGIIGCAVAYHLSRLGWRDCVLLEREKLTCGTTFHAAGLVGQLRNSPAVTELIRRSVQLYETLELETGAATGWRRSGGLRLARSALRLRELENQAVFSRKLGIEVAMLTPSEAIELCPIISAQDLVGKLRPQRRSDQPLGCDASLGEGGAAAWRSRYRRLSRSWFRARFKWDSSSHHSGWPHRV